jgi:hypothetical protein
MGTSSSLRATRKELMSLPIGAADPRAFIYNWGRPHEGVKGYLTNVFVANIPQVLLSVIYFAYNGIFTSFTLGHEWDGYSWKRKGLRVSTNPQGGQRSTYFLQLPYKFALPLMTLSGALHWLCSQGIFFVHVEILRLEKLWGGYKSPGREGATVIDYMNCGYSPIAILAVIVLGCVMLIIAIVLGRFRYKTPMPVSGSCSASISAACHMPETERREQAALLPVLWGVTGNEWVAEVNAEVGHCSFSSEEVSKPEDGMLYAGLTLRR